MVISGDESWCTRYLYWWLYRITDADAKRQSRHHLCGGICCWLSWALLHPAGSCVHQAYRICQQERGRGRIRGRRGVGDTGCYTHAYITCRPRGDKSIQCYNIVRFSSWTSNSVNGHSASLTQAGTIHSPPTDHCLLCVCSCVISHSVTMTQNACVTINNAIMYTAWKIYDILTFLLIIFMLQTD